MPKLRGMFAFTFYDSKSNELLVARDPFSIKPLFYAEAGGDIMFASEVQQLLLCDKVRSDINPQLVYEYAHTGATEHSNNSMFKDIKSFPAASFAKVNLGSTEPLTIKKYWEIDLGKKITPTFSEAVKEVRKLFLDSVRLHVRSDVEVGAALSGGIDSSAIVCAMHYINPEHKIHTFSYVASDYELSEEKWIDIVNEHVGAIVHKINVNNFDLVEDLDDLVKTQGEPFSGTNLYAQYRVFKAAKDNGIKVVLDGQGADEMLAGYLFYQPTVVVGLLKKFKWLRAAQFFNSCVQNTSTTPGSLLKGVLVELTPSLVYSFLKNLILKHKRIKWLSYEWVKKSMANQKKFYNREKKLATPLESHLFSSLCELGIPKLLRYEDRNSMRWSVESRVPFLHVELVEYLFSLPSEYLLGKNAESKLVFREAMRGIVPDSILDRKDKIGFATPEKAWLTQMDSWVKGVLKNSESLEIFETSELLKEWENVISGRTQFDNRCWRWINLITWIRANDK